MKNILAAIFLISTCTLAESKQVSAVVDISNQTVMIVSPDFIDTWDVSTGKHGFSTPLGNFRGKWLSENHVSSIYNVPMPNAVFFNGNIAFHATNAISKLGNKASHGCVRLSPKNSYRLFSIVKKYGLQNFYVSVRE